MVVKPRDGNQGKGVAVNIATREEVMAAYAVAVEFRDDVMVERYLPGHDYRLLVIGNQLVAAARRDPPQVIGDGEHTIRELVDIVNRDPLRSDGHATSLTKIRFDDIALATLAGQHLQADLVETDAVAERLHHRLGLGAAGQGGVGGPVRGRRGGLGGWPGRGRCVRPRG